MRMQLQTSRFPVKETKLMMATTDDSDVWDPFAESSCGAPSGSDDSSPTFSSKARLPSCKKDTKQIELPSFDKKDLSATTTTKPTQPRQHRRRKSLTSSTSSLFKLNHTECSQWVSSSTVTAPLSHAQPSHAQTTWELSRNEGTTTTAIESQTVLSHRRRRSLPSSQNICIAAVNDGCHIPKLANSEHLPAKRTTTTKLAKSEHALPFKHKTMNTAPNKFFDSSTAAAALAESKIIPLQKRRRGSLKSSKATTLTRAELETKVTMMALAKAATKSKSDRNSKSRRSNSVSGIKTRPAAVELNELETKLTTMTLSEAAAMSRSECSVRNRRSESVCGIQSLPAVDIEQHPPTSETAAAAADEPQTGPPIRRRRRLSLTSLHRKSTSQLNERGGIKSEHNSKQKSSPKATPKPPVEQQPEKELELQSLFPSWSHDSNDEAEQNDADLQAAKQQQQQLPKMMKPRRRYSPTSLSKPNPSSQDNTSNNPVDAFHESFLNFGALPLSPHVSPRKRISKANLQQQRGRSPRLSPKNNLSSSCSAAAAFHKSVPTLPTLSPSPRRTRKTFTHRVSLPAATMLTTGNKSMSQLPSVPFTGGKSQLPSAPLLTGNKKEDDCDIITGKSEIGTASTIANENKTAKKSSTMMKRESSKLSKAASERLNVELVSTQQQEENTNDIGDVADRKSKTKSIRSSHSKSLKTASILTQQQKLGGDRISRHSEGGIRNGSSSLLHDETKRIRSSSASCVKKKSGTIKSTTTTGRSSKASSTIAKSDTSSIRYPSPPPRQQQEPMSPLFVLEEDPIVSPCRDYISVMKRRNLNRDPEALFAAVCGNFL